MYGSTPSPPGLSTVYFLLLPQFFLTTLFNSKTSTLIDLFTTNNKESFVYSGVYSLTISDHNLIFAVRKIGVPRQSPRFVETRNFKKFDVNAFR